MLKWRKAVIKREKEGREVEVKEEKVEEELDEVEKMEQIISDLKQKELVKIY